MGGTACETTPKTIVSHRRDRLSPLYKSGERPIETDAKLLKQRERRIYTMASGDGAR